MRRKRITLFAFVFIVLIGLGSDAADAGGVCAQAYPVGPWHGGYVCTP
jgi:hypothetical protein